MPLGIHASLAKPKPARDPTLRLRSLPLHRLVKVINRLVKLLFGIVLRLVELGCGIAREFFELGLGLAHFGSYGLVGFADFVADIADLWVCKVFGQLRSNREQSRVEKEDESIRCYRSSSPQSVPILRLAFSLLRQRCSGLSTRLWRFRHHLSMRISYDLALSSGLPVYKRSAFFCATLVSPPAVYK